MTSWEEAHARAVRGFDPLARVHGLLLTVPLASPAALAVFGALHAALVDLLPLQPPGSLLPARLLLLLLGPAPSAALSPAAAALLAVPLAPAAAALLAVPCSVPQEAGADTVPVPAAAPTGLVLLLRRRGTAPVADTPGDAGLVTAGGARQLPVRLHLLSADTGRQRCQQWSGGWPAYSRKG